MIHSLRLIISCTAFLLLTFVATAQATERPVFAHWIVPMGYTDSETGNMRRVNDIRAAMELGIDGFVMNVFNKKQATGLMLSYSVAAEQIGAEDFRMFWSFDMSMGFDPQDIVDAMKAYGRGKYYFKIDGKPVLSTYSGQKLGNDWWDKNVITPLRQAGMEVVFIPGFNVPNSNRDDPSYENWIRVFDKFPVMDGTFTFPTPKSVPFYSNEDDLGNYRWSMLEAQENRAKAARDLGKYFMAYYVPYYWFTCKPVRQYLETQGGIGMHNQWMSIINNQIPDIVQIVTWNDYSESTSIQPTRIPKTKTEGLPSLPHLGSYELLKYYISWYKTGQKPAITDDAMFFFYRTHPKDARASDDRSVCNLGPTQPHQKWGKPEDVIYMTTALTAPAQLIVETGADVMELDVDAGLITTKIPFQPGAQSFSLRRDAETIVEAKGMNIDASPVIYNFGVFSGYAIADGETSESWLPSDKWKRGFQAEWFTNISNHGH